jgi:hypothetical protein
LRYRKTKQQLVDDNEQAARIALYLPQLHASHAGVNFALTAFYEVRQKNPEQKLHLSAYFHRRFIASCSNGLKELPSVGLRNEGGGAYEAHSLVGHGGVGHGGDDVGHGDAGFRWCPGW